MFIGSEAETEGAGGPDLPMKIISCHLFPRRKTGTNLPREAICPPTVGIVWIRARMSELADLRLCCLHTKKFLTELGKKAKLQI